MRHLLPGRHELMILVVMELACALIASARFSSDTALSVGAMPLFVASCLMGMRRNGQLSGRRKSID